MSRIRTLTLLGSLAIAVSACAAGNGGTVASPSAASTATPEVTSGLATASPAATPLIASSAPTSIAASEAWIAYEGPISDAAGIRLVRPDGTNDHWAMPDVPRGPGDWQLHPDWSPDGTQIAFSMDSKADGTRALWIADADGSDAKRIVGCEAPCMVADDPAWSPDGSRIAYTTWAGVAGVNPPAELAIYDVATGSTLPLAFTEGADYFMGPRWSPDGDRIVVELLTLLDRKVVTETTTGSTIAIVDARAAVPAARPLPDLPEWACYPDWSPDGERIVFSTRPWSMLPGGPSNLYTVRPDGTDLTQITHFKAGETRAVQPTWSPDGSLIIFTAVEGAGFGNPTMATIKPDGTGLTSATTSGPMFGTHPRLRPMP